MKRLFAVFALALVASLFAGVPPTGAGAGGPEVNVLHGLAEGPVDVYVGSGAAPASFDLLAENMVFGDYDAVGSLPAGDWTVQICTHTVAAAGTITQCSDNAGSTAVNGNGGNLVTIPNVASVTLLLSYGGPASAAPGRPAATIWEDDLSCVDAGTGRLQGVHSAASEPIATDPMPVNLLVDGTEEFSDLVYGDVGTLDNVAPADYDVEFQLAADDSPLAGDTNTPVTALYSTTVWLVGNAQLEGYEVVVTQLPLPECTQPTTTTTSTTLLPVTPTTQPVTAVTPAFTG